MFVCVLVLAVITVFGYLFSINVNMYALVLYDDGVYYVTNTKNISSRHRHVGLVKYGDGRRFGDGQKYSAEILCTNSSRSILTEIKQNLSNGVPQIEITFEAYKNLMIEGSSEKNTVSDNLFDEDNIEYNNNSHDLDYNIECSSEKNPERLLEEDDDDSIADPDFVVESSDEENADILFEDDDDDDRTTVPNFFVENSGERNTDKQEENDERIVKSDFVIEDTSEDNACISNDKCAWVWQQPPKCTRGFKQMNPKIETSNKTKKRYFCIYCKKLVLHFPRHLEMLHHTEDDVKYFSDLPKGSLERKRIIEIIRKRGNFQYNCDVNYNEGNLITVRRPKKCNVYKNYLSCPRCLGFYSKFSLKKHLKKCSPNLKRNKSRTNHAMARRVQGDVSELANDIVRIQIFPILREDDITTPLRYDFLTIIYANKMTVKYRKPHHFAMIRSRIRLIGRILYEFRKINSSVKDFADIYQPKNYDSVISAINVIGKLDLQQRLYKAPSAASSAGTLLKKCGQIYVTELIKQQNKVRKEEVEDFLKLIEVDFGIAINKTVAETQSQLKRQKTIVLPRMDDFKALNLYLKNNRRKYFKQLKKSFDVGTFVNLQCFTMISVQVFNRRRAGEIQRIEIGEFKNYQSVNQNSDPDFFQNLSEELRRAAANYVRFTIRGKLGREVPVLLYGELVDCIKLLIEIRSVCGILEKNPFIFAVPGTEDKCHSACKLMREYSALCGAKKPVTLRGTTLRKHIATQSVFYNLNDNEVSDLANFMGHAEKIHKEHYRMPIATRDITRMSRLLEMAQGGTEDDEQEHTSDEEDLDNSLDVEYESESANTLINNSLKEQSDDNKKIEVMLNLHSNKKRSTSPMGMVNRRSWNNLEITTVKHFFEDNLKTGQLPSLQKCQEVIRDNKSLQTRSPMQLKAWISNQIKKNKIETLPSNSTPVKPTKISVKRIRWSTPEKTAATELVGDYIKSNKLPSLNLCRKYIKDNSVLQDRTATQLKLWTSNQIKKKQCHKI